MNKETMTREELVQTLQTLQEKHDKLVETH
jgi:hypothetical protein